MPLSKAGIAAMRALWVTANPKWKGVSSCCTIGQVGVANESVQLTDTTAPKSINKFCNNDGRQAATSFIYLF